MTILITTGASNRYLEDLSPDITRDWFLDKVVETKLVEDNYIGDFRVFPDSQDHLGEVQGPKTSKSRPWARTTPGIDFWAKLLKQKLFGMFRWVDFNFFRTARTIWVRSRHQRLPGVGREQGQHQGLIFEQSCWNKSCLGCLDGLISTFSGQPGPSGWGPDTKDCQE